MQYSVRERVASGVLTTMIDVGLFRTGGNAGPLAEIELPELPPALRDAKHPLRVERTAERISLCWRMSAFHPIMIFPLVISAVSLITGFVVAGRNIVGAGAGGGAVSWWAVVFFFGIAAIMSVLAFAIRWYRGQMYGAELAAPSERRTLAAMDLWTRKVHVATAGGASQEVAAPVVVTGIVRLQMGASPFTVSLRYAAIGERTADGVKLVVTLTASPSERALAVVRAWADACGIPHVQHAARAKID